jgi:TfoX/Sxy family transcriptional regulator of competence genes
MAFNEELAQRLRILLADQAHITEKKMFGGLSFLYKKKMSIGIITNHLAVRVVPEKYDHFIEQADVEEMTFTGKAMKEFLYVYPSAFETDEQLKAWIDLGLEHAKYKLKE